ncbi:cyclic nucleotide-binding domain-containing protein 2-like [Carcharodon carcharias]|uniref:cyclic nucleotide-binding domain-containing protein 2-like n=1 Tax=Carcharodon carcharias TaxID=13397 RepID=UPI001B7E06C2|nr:cyclic nucleotide-binding domain-containing protein 2-like [Carcharodon carcharias]
MCRVCMRLREASAAFMQVWATLAKYANKQQTEEEQRESSKAAFDAQYFKTQHNKFPTRAIQVTMKLPEQRSMEELEELLCSLRSLLSIRHYSKPYQLMLAKIVRYERLRRRRVIIKKGQDAHSFYFIYSGGVSFTTDEDGSSAFEEGHQTDLRKGARFGEIPVLKGLQRNFTAVCTDDTELLVVDKEEFFENRLDKALVREYHRRFIFFRSLKLLESLPDSSIEFLSDYSTTEEFLYGQVIPTNMEHLIFVTKGRFVILRLVDLTLCPSYHRFIAHELPFLKSTIKNTESADNSQVDRQFSGSSRTTSTHLGFDNTSRTKIKKISSSRSQTPFRGSPSSMKSIETLSQNISSSNISVAQSGSPQQVKARSETGRRLRLGRSTSRAVFGDFRHILGTTLRRQMVPKALAVAAYMKIDSVLPGEVFGLRQYFVANDLKDKREFSIKSQGTKIVRIDMQTFTELTDPLTLHKVQKLKSIYPSDDELCDCFIKNNIWKILKKNMIAQLPSKPHLYSTSGQAAVSGQGEDIYEIDKTGILNLPEIASNRSMLFSKPSYYVAPVIRSMDGSTTLPKLDLQLIHAIAKHPSSVGSLLP